MERLEIDLREEDRQKIASFLTKLLASTYALYLKTQNYHWNVKGMDFFSLHVMFEKQYEEFAETIDEMAERIRALGHTIEGSLEAFAKISIIKGEEQLPNAKEMLARLLKDHEEMSCFLRKNLPFTEQVHDGATADFINKRLAAHEKTSWMIRSHIAN